MAFENRRQEGSPFTPTEEAWVQSGASGITILKHSAAPSGAAGYGKLYTNEADGLLYFLTAGGVSYNLTAAAGGDVIGPASSTDNAIVRFDSTTGKLVQNSAATVDDSGSLNIPAGQKYKINGIALSAADVGAGTGDMAKATYDPNNRNADAFNADNHVSGTTNKVFTAVEQAKLAGAGDMAKATYDPDNKAANAFNTDNHVDGTTNKVYTATEKTKLAGIAAGATAGADWNTNVANKPSLGGAASLNVGTAAGTVAAGDHVHATYAPLASPTFTGGIGIGATAGASQRIILKTLAAGASFGLKIEHDNAGNTAFGTYVTGDANMRFDFDAVGKMEWGDGSGNVDTNLYRSAANTLKTDDSLVVSGGLKVVGAMDARRIVQLKIMDDSTAVTTGDGKLIFCVPPELNGYNLVDADAFVTTVSSSGTPTIQIRNVTDSVDMLSTRITIDASEFTSYTAATQPVIDTTKDDVATGDLLAIDVDVAGTGTKGLGVTLGFQLP